MYDKKSLVEWSEIPKSEQKSGYWLIRPKDPDSILDSLQYEIGFVYYDGKWVLFRPGEDTHYYLDSVYFIHPILIDCKLEPCDDCRGHGKLFIGFGAHRTCKTCNGVGSSFQS